MNYDEHIHDNNSCSSRLTTKKSAHDECMTKNRGNQYLMIKKSAHRYMMIAFLAHDPLHYQIFLLMIKLPVHDHIFLVIGALGQ